MHIAAPVRKHLHPDVEKDLRADEGFDLLARRGTDGTDTLSARADEDPLLTLSLDVDDGTNVDGRLVFAELLDLACDAVRDLFLELLECRFANELGHEEAHRLRADL